MTDKLKTPDETPFTLKSDAAFVSRADDIFGNLGHIEAKHNAYEKARSTCSNDDYDGLIKEDPQEDVILGPIRDQSGSSSKVSGFKRPHPPAPSSRKCPDYKLNPGKWTYYNLEDVSPESMSEKSNKEAAESFLNSLQSAKSNKKQKTDPDDTITKPDAGEGQSLPKVIFRKPEKKDDSSETQSVMPSGDDQGVIVMPEYIIGQKKSTIRKPRSTAQSKPLSEMGVKISHVMEDDDDEEEEEDSSSSTSSNEESLAAKPTRTVFSGCVKDTDESVKPMETDQGFIGFLGKKTRKNLKNKAIRCARDSDSEQEGSELSKDEIDLEGVD